LWPHRQFINPHAAPSDRADVGAIFSFSEIAYNDRCSDVFNVLSPSERSDLTETGGVDGSKIWIGGSISDFAMLAVQIG
jgi:hypothetical protein